MNKRFTMMASVLMLMASAAFAASNNQQSDSIYNIELTQDEQQMVERNNVFAFNLFRKSRGNDSNILSPLSITYALGMLNNGAAGQTQQEIYNVLGFNNADEQNEFCNKMICELNKAGVWTPTTKAEIANTIFVNSGKGWQLKPSFTNKVNQYYDAYPQARDFSDGETRDIINQWASDHTEHMINEVLGPNDFNPLAVSYLLNAIYFKGVWSDPFKADNTKDEPFANGETVPMMHKDYTLMPYAENDLYQTVILPYDNGTYQMQLFLPCEGKTIDDVLKSLKDTNWKISGRQYEVDLKLPRFETDTDIDLNSILCELGMPTAFDEYAADFSDLCVDNYGANFYIGMMKQVAKIKVDEMGTEAAAVTVIGEYTTAMFERRKLHANRPFLYIISEQSTGIILFIGQYTGSNTNKSNTFLTTVDTPRQSRDTRDDALYNLAGQRLQRVKTPLHGIFIRNGKKVVR